MEEVLNQSAVDTEPQMETASPQTDTNQDQPISQETSATTQVSSDQQDKGWIKKVRRDRDEAIRRAEEAERRDKMKDELIKQLMDSQTQTKVAEDNILDSIQREEYVAGDKVAKALKQQQESFDRKIAELQKIQEKNVWAKQEDEIRRQFEDFDDIVNPDTLDMLKETNPKLFSRVTNLLKADPMDGAVFAYEQIIASGVADQIPGLRRKKEVDKKLEQNKKTVQSPISHDSRPIAQAMNFADNKKAKDALWAETQRYASQAGFGY